MGNDLNEVFYSACALLGKNYFVDARYRAYAGLKASARLVRGTVVARASREFERVPREVALGLALSLLSKIFRVRVEARLVRPYEEFVKSKGAAELSDALRGARGRARRGVARGENHDLDALLDGLYSSYPTLFSGVARPRVEWSRSPGRRRLGWFDSAFAKIVLNRALDGAPRLVAEYVLYHELLHAKHAVLYSRGKSLRRSVHTRAFKQEDALFAGAGEAEAWLRKNWNRISRGVNG
ncbi:MAG: hypothetical protein WC607_01840 [Candidatus Micrarchaeia archaeon]